MGSVVSLVFSPDGTTLAVSGSAMADFAGTFDGKNTTERSRRLTRPVTGPGRLKIWNVKTGELERDLDGHSRASSSAFSPDGNFLVSVGSWEGLRSHGTGAIIWIPRTGELLRMMETGANGGTNAVAISPDSKLMVVSSQNFDKDHDTGTGTICLSHVRSGILEWKQVVQGWAKPLSFSPDGKSIAVLIGGTSIQFIQVETGKTRELIKLTDSPETLRWTNMAISQQGGILAVGGVDKASHGIVEIWTFHSVPKDPLSEPRLFRQ